MRLDWSAAPPAMVTLRPGPLRLNIENRENTRALPGVWIAGPELEQLLFRRKRNRRGGNNRSSLRSDCSPIKPSVTFITPTRTAAISQLNRWSDPYG